MTRRLMSVGSDAASSPSAPRAAVMLSRATAARSYPTVVRRGAVTFESGVSSIPMRPILAGTPPPTPGSRGEQRDRDVVVITGDSVARLEFIQRGGRIVQVDAEADHRRRGESGFRARVADGDLALVAVGIEAVVAEVGECDRLYPRSMRCSAWRRPISSLRLPPVDVSKPGIPRSASNLLFGFGEWLQREYGPWAHAGEDAVE